MSDRLLLGTRKGLFTVARGAKGWRIERASFVSQNSTMVMHDPRDNSIYAAIGHGHFGAKLHRSTDGGESWKEIQAPVYPKQPEDEKWLTYFGEPVKWSLHMIWELVPGGADQPGQIWCGTIPGGLFVSKDCGQSWEMVRSLWDDPRRLKWMGGGADYPGIHSIAVHPKNSNHVSLAVSSGGVWVTENGGTTWELRGKGLIADFLPPEQASDPDGQDPHRMVQCPADPDTLWIQHHCGIFKSTDAGRNFTYYKKVEPSSFGFAVVVHPKDPNTAWFVPADSAEARVPLRGEVVVTRTRDGGATFQSLRKGLPQDHAYDIVFRHCLDVDESGNRLAFGSTTGNVWLSEDQGDSWQSLSTNLPPVYCARFVKPS